MPLFEIYLSSEDTNRLFALKKLQGKNPLTGNEFARELLEKELHRCYPSKVEYDEYGEEILPGKEV